MYKKILIPLDNSPSDKAILDHLQPLIRMTKAEIILVHVSDGYVARLQQQLNLDDSEEIQVDKKYLEERRIELDKEGFKVKAFLALGEPADKILSIAEREQCDLIAMSTHGHRFLKDILLGSVAENIRHRTNIPILMIRAAT